MAQADIDDFVLPEMTGIASAMASTPMQRAANQLQKVLPPGWRVEVVASSQGTARRGQPVLRLVMGDF
ncbi:hypothetical protein [Nocardia acidivorans]|uniref:hypothetical protein n=1 Tax=Nocardia acidivorans TaxID=404580 RepID=UPI0008311693|nr:hypothetical protein [Nocardia acidivorans]